MPSRARACVCVCVSVCVCARARAHKAPPLTCSKAQLSDGRRASQLTRPSPRLQLLPVHQEQFLGPYEVEFQVARHFKGGSQELQHFLHVQLRKRGADDLDCRGRKPYSLCKEPSRGREGERGLDPTPRAQGPRSCRARPALTLVPGHRLQDLL